jgi:hypothetical protein
MAVWVAVGLAVLVGAAVAVMVDVGVAVAVGRMGGVVGVGGDGRSSAPQPSNNNKISSPHFFIMPQS